MKQLILRSLLRMHSGTIMNTSRQAKVEIVYFDAGGGHRSAALALRAALETVPEINVELVQLQELLQTFDPAYQLTGLPSEQVYNAALKRGWTYGSRPFLRVLQKGIALEAPAMRRKLARWWSDRAPDLVVSVVPNFNRILFDALGLAHPGIPFVTIMTDFADTPPSFWMDNRDQYLICGTRKAALQATLLGYYRPERIIETSGMIIHPRFYEARSGAPRFSRAELGLAPANKVALVSFGGSGSEESLEVVEQLNKAGVDSIVLCGRNEKLLSKLKGRPSVCAVPFTDRVADYLTVADFFVGKPGPGSISEAALMGLPVIVTSSSRTMIQERYNVTWVEENGIGIGIPSLEMLPRAANYLLRPDNFAGYRARVNAVNINAIREIPAILQRILTERNTSPLARAA